jgi:hypothetical protein
MRQIKSVWGQLMDCVKNSLIRLSPKSLHLFPTAKHLVNEQISATQRMSQVLIIIQWGYKGYKVVVTQSEVGLFGLQRGRLFTGTAH